MKLNAIDAIISIIGVDADFAHVIAYYLAFQDCSQFHPNTPEFKIWVQGRIIPQLLSVAQ